MTRSVSVQKLNMEWFYKDKMNFVAFSADCLQKLPNTVFTSQFVQTLLDLYWPKTQKAIFLKQFLPFCVFVILSIGAFVYSLADVKDREVRDTGALAKRVILALLILITWVHQFTFEVLQFKSDKWLYFKLMWNWID